MHGLLGRLPKPLRFAISAAVGCLLLALLAERVLPLGQSEAGPQVDVMFVLDVTGSMEEEINGVRDGIIAFVGALRSRSIGSTRVGLIAYRDRSEGEEPRTLRVGGEPFTTHLAGFRREVGSLRADGGGDEPESTLDALALAAEQPFRPGAKKVLLLITDAPPRVPDKDTTSVAGAVQALRGRGMDQLHLVIQDGDLPAYEELHAAIPGEVFSLADSAAGRAGFDRILPEVGKQIAAALGTGSVAAERRWLLIGITALWTGLVAIGAFLALMIAQNLYLRRRVLGLRQGIGGTLGSFAAGAVAGAAAQGLFGVLRSDVSGRMLCWALLGALLGWGTAYFIPNLKKVRAAVGGLAGGAMGALGFLAGAQALDDATGRLTGAAIVGFFIGLMIALVEQLARDAHLIVHWTPGQSSRIALGAEPVLMGSSPDAHIRLPKEGGFAPIVGAFTLVDGQIAYEDRESGRRDDLGAGGTVEVGGIKIEVKAGK